MTRVALYARYSSDHQRDASIEDQLRLCREHSEHQGWHVIESYACGVKRGTWGGAMSGVNGWVG